MIRGRRAVLVLVTAGITLLGDLVQRTSGRLGELIGVGTGTLAGGVVHAASFVLSIVVVLLLYRFVPSREASASATVSPERSSRPCSCG